MSQLKLCTHTKHDGTPCQAIPVTDSPYCYFHRSYYKAPALPGDPKYSAPLLESHHSIQLALTDLYQSFLTGKIGFKEAQFALRLLRLASKTITEIERKSKENATGAPFKPAVGLSGVVNEENSEGKGTPVAPDRPEVKPAPTVPIPALTPKAPASNPFVTAKPPQSVKSFTDVDLAPMKAELDRVKRQTEVSNK